MEKFTILTQGGARVQAAVGDEDVFRFTQLLKASSEVVSFTGDSSISAQAVYRPTGLSLQDHIKASFKYHLPGMAIPKGLYEALLRWFELKPSKVEYEGSITMYNGSAYHVVLYGDQRIEIHSDKPELRFGNIQLCMATGVFSIN